MAFNIYELRTDGTARWTREERDSSSAREALGKAHERSALVVVGKTYFVVDPAVNPRGDQCLFQLEQSGVTVKPVRLGR